MWEDQAGAAQAGRATSVDPANRLVLQAIDHTPTATSVIAERTGLPIGALSAILLRLESRRLVRGQGAWWERADAP
jgi:predicted Rossmann fold nucleotide-binding protein DprA/Smf involved in DNA uptake